MGYTGKRRELTMATTRGDERAVLLLLLVLLCGAVLWHGDVSVALPPARLLLELGLCNSFAMLCNGAVATAIYVYPCATPLWFAGATLLLALPYTMSTTIIWHAAPVCSMALILFVGAWKTFDILLGTAPVGILSSHAALATRLASPLDYLCSEDGTPLASPRWRCLQLSVAFGFRAAGLASLSSCVLLVGPRLPYALRIYADTWSVFFFLAIVGDSLSIILSALGFQPAVLFRDPLTRATSPSDFWGRRWNLLIHGLFKRTIYFPITKRGVPPAAAAAFAFLISGAFHEYAFLAPAAARAAGASFGTCAFFFLAQAPVITAEKCLGWFVGCAASAVGLSPGSGGRAAASSLLTTVLLVPFAPLFMHAPEASGLMDEMRQLFPHLAPRALEGRMHWNGWDALARGELPW